MPSTRAGPQARGSQVRPATGTRFTSPASTIRKRGPGRARTAIPAPSRSAPAADDVIRVVSSFYVPVFEKILSDGIVEYELDREVFHNTDSRSQIHFSFV